MVLMSGVRLCQGQDILSSFNEVNLADGLSELTNINLFQDTDGFLWVSSADGLNRYDGQSISVFRPRSAQNESDPSITGGGFEDEESVLWWTAIGGLYQLDKEKYGLKRTPFLNPKDSSPALEHYAFHLDMESNIWMVVDGYLHLKNTVSGKDSVLHSFNASLCYAVEKKEGGVTHLLYPLLDEPSGIGMISYDQGEVFREKFFTKDDPKGLPEAQIFFIHIENDSIVWAPSNLGLLRFNINFPELYETYQHILDGQARSYCDAQAWGEKYLWVASSREGLLLFDKTEKVFIKQNTVIWVDGEPEKLSRVNKIYIDSYDNIWLAIWGKGIYHSSLKNNKFSSFLSDNFPESKSISSIILDQDDRLWSIVSGEGVIVFDPDSTRETPLKKLPIFELPGFINQPNYLYCDSDGDVWILAYNKVIIWEKKTDRYRLISDDLNEVQFILEVAEGRFLLMTYSKIFEISKKNRFILNDKGIADFDHSLHNFFHTSDDRLIVSDIISLSIFSIGESKYNLLAEKKNIGFVNGMGEDAQAYWLASNKGLVRIRKSDLSHEFIKDREDLLNRSFNGLLMDDKGEIWLSSNNGIFHYNPETEVAQHFTQSDGLRNTQFNLASQFKDVEGKLYFGSKNGITYFDPAQIKLNQNLPIVQLTEVLINSSDTLKGYDLSSVKELSFPYTENTLSFNFVSIEYSAPHENQHAYFLEGYDRDTVYTDTRGFAHYPNLSYGRYTLRLMGSNSDGVWTPEPRELEIIILRPWYHTWWFRITGLLSFLFMVYWLYRKRIKSIEEREAIKLREAEFRQKQAQSKQEVAEHKMALLRLQMNPHFFSNSLSAIGHYILDEAPRTAYGFLQHFSTLMRGVLEKAAHPYISLEEEIELLTSFLEIKSLELAEEQLSWKIEVDERLDQDEVLVPTMLVQPIVENAIEHGIAPKKEKGSVHVTFKQDKEKLVCTVQDDGIGRAAAQLKSAKKGISESKAMAITLDRLRLLQEETGMVASMEVIDLMTEEGMALGTKVVLTLPLKG